MSLIGKLEDVPVVDVLQFVHLGSRTGTLTIKSRGREARIGLHRGRIVSATGPHSQRLGDLLIRNRLLSEDDLVRALHLQQAERPHRSLGAILAAQNICTDEQIQHAIEEQIEQTVYEVVSWNTGKFEFQLDELEPVDDIGLYPGDIIPRVDLNTQMVLVHAMQIFDERHRQDVRDAKSGEHRTRTPDNHDRAGPGESQTTLRSGDSSSHVPAANGTTSVSSVTAARESWCRGGESSAGTSVIPQLQVVTRDDALIASLKDEIPDREARITKVRLRAAGSATPGHTAPVVLIDMRKGLLNATAVASLRRARPRAAVMVVNDSDTMLCACYRAGALAVLPAQASVIAAAFVSVLRNRCDQSSEAVVSQGMREGFAKLRRVFGDLRSGFMSATMSLNLMSIVSESTERAVLFLVQRQELAVLGAFGFGVDSLTLAELANGMVLPIGDNNALADCLSDGRVQLCTYDEADLPERLRMVLGPPRSNQIAVFPVLGGRSVIAVVYADNGMREGPLQEVELLSLATSQVGVAFENEMLRRQIAHSTGGQQ